MASEVDELIRAIRATGTHSVQSIGSHHKVTDSAGSVVYVMPKTPSDRRWRDNAVRGLVKAGVFEKDPRKSNGKPKSKHHIASPEMQAKKVAAVKARHAHFSEITRGIRSRIEPLVTKCGGWGAGKGQVTASELGMVAKYWGRDRPDVFSTDEAARSSAQSNIRQGGTLAEKSVAFWSDFATAWESADDPTRWYFDLVREMKGLPKTQVIIGGEPQPERTEAKKKYSRPRAGKVTTSYIEEELDEETPAIFESLALKAVILMAIGSDPSDRELILQTGERILQLEQAAK